MNSLDADAFLIIVFINPYLAQAICATIKSKTKPIFAEYVGKYMIEAIEFEHLTLGTLPPTIHGKSFM